jgi:hypothetical protein
MISPPARAKNRSRIRTKPQKKTEFVSLRSAPSLVLASPSQFQTSIPSTMLLRLFPPPFPLDPLLRPLAKTI